MSIDLTLDRIERLYRLIQAYTRPTIHIAGTNGKGSVSALTSSILTAAGLSVGRFNSPHLITIYDCIYVNNQEVSPQTYHEARDNVEGVAHDNSIEISSFEMLVLTALLIFERVKVDIVVMEVGMGGRLDATNVIPDEVVMISALTAVDLDHQAFLGDTVAAITKEKASIARRGKPFVMGPQKHSEVAEVARMVVQEAGGDFFSAPSALQMPSEDQRRPESYSQFQPPSPCPIELNMPCFRDPFNALLPLHGSHQLENVGLSAFIISVAVDYPSCSSLGLRDRVTPQVVVRGIANVSWPGRLSFHPIPKNLHDPCSPKALVLADGAHNPASSTTLSRYLMDYCNSPAAPNATTAITYILSLSHSPPKTPLQTLSPLLPPSLPSNLKVRVAVLRFASPEGMPWVKSVLPSVLYSVVQSLCPKAELWKGDDDRTDNLSAALQWATSSSDPNLVVVAGSLYLVADFYRILRGLDSVIL
ncbi:Mur ligase [Lentinula edodes]|uniref:Mur ligase n=1 Tax=Lentinula edodes TaxID=5353 RepID=UPI001E8ED616|nr:Mur ligase [Lentinula edodes]KAH7873239.1 Mur ligase [Lentinula edodes]KAJ3910697.1 Mur ligase [Lentinula edodes]KAJ3922394.1 Mur ligase [Lentinula edodes]